MIEQFSRMTVCTEQVKYGTHTIVFLIFLSLKYETAFVFPQAMYIAVCISIFCKTPIPPHTKTIINYNSICILIYLHISHNIFFTFKNHYWGFFQVTNLTKFANGKTIIATPLFLVPNEQKNHPMSNFYLR